MTNVIAPDKSCCVLAADYLGLPQIVNIISLLGCAGYQADIGRWHPLQHKHGISLVLIPCQCGQLEEAAV